jgi:uncharacterized protein (TIGR00369 family)
MTRLEPHPAATDASPETMLARLTASVCRSPLAALLDIRPTRCWNGESELIIPIRPDITQHHGTVHGGVVGIAADDACCWAAASVVGDVVTANYSVHFLAPARGEILRGVGTLVRVGKRTATARAEIYADSPDGSVLVATALASIAILDPDRG